MSFKDKLMQMYIPGCIYTRVDYITGEELIFDHFEPARSCSIDCFGEFGQCDGTRLNFKNYNQIVCPYSNRKLRHKCISKIEFIESNTRW